ncbi:MAG: pre-peptidase C-terminal domain-containing protein, partial [Victivallales bacterium]
GTTRMIINTTGGAAGEDCDIYISPDVIPTLESYFAKSTGPTTVESITVLNPEVGKDWYILVYGYKAYNGVDLNISMFNDVPDKPVLASASQGDPLNPGKVTLLWSDCSGSGAVSYDIFRSKDNIPELAEFVKNVGLGATVTADDTSAVLGTHYYYWIRARSGAGDSKSSDFSNSEQGWIADGTVVKNLSNGVSVTGIKGDAGTTRIFTFTVPVASPVVKLLEIKTSAGTGDCDISISKGGVILVYGVKVTNNEIIRIEDPSAGEYEISLYGNTEYSGLALRAKYYNAKPLPPASPLASDGTYADAIPVSWTASDGASSYEVWRAAIDIGAAIPKTAAADKIGETSDSSFVDNINLAAGKIYYYWIKALNGAGTSAFSAGSSGYVSKTPAAPSSVSASDGTYFDKIRVTWPKVAGATSYLVYRDAVMTIPGLPIAEVAYASNLATYTFDDMGGDSPSPNPANPIYYYWIIAKNGNGTSAPKMGSGYVKKTGPAGITASDGTYFNKVKIAWTAFAGAAEYEVYSSSSNDTDSASPIGTSTSPEYYDELVSGKTFYWVKARYINPDTLDEYLSGFSASNSGYSKDLVTTVAAPVLKSVSNGTSEKVSIVWGEVPTATKYTVYRRILAADPWVALPLATEITALNHDDATGDALQKYMYCVKAINDIAGKESALSAPKTGYKTDVNTDFATVAPVDVVSGGLNSEKIYYIDVPAGTTRLVAQVENGDGGDCDLYAKFGSCPTKTIYNAKGSEISGAGNKEILTVANPADGRWYLLLYGTAAYSGVQFSINCYSATNIVFSLVPADDRTVPFTAQFKGRVLDDVDAGIPGLVVGARDPLTGLTAWLPKTDAKGNFTYSTKIAADGEYTYDFYLSTIPDSTLSIGSWTVKTKRNPWESNNFFDFSGYLAGTRIPVADIEAQGGTLGGLEQYMNVRRGFADGSAVDPYEDIWLTNTLAAAPADPKITSKLDAGLYLLFYGTEGAAVGNGPASAPAGLVASPLLVRVSPAKQAAVIANLKANGLIDNAVAGNVTENGGIGVVVVAAYSNPDETGSDFDYDISLYANEQLELLANIAGDNEVEPNVTPEKKYGGTVARLVIISLDGATRRIGAAVTSFMK